ncbi:restriction endonuclease subunit S [Parabacteroides johnsonii]|nr:restriction endonuclease subunit S [Parabacteroides johnsonii]
MSQFIEMFGTVESYCKLEDLVSDTFPGEWGSEPTSENAIKVIRTTNFTNEGHLDLADVVTRDIEPKKVARKKLKQGDTILERSGGTKDNPVGRVVFFDEIGDYLLNNFTQALRPKESVNPVYLFYALYNSYNINKAAMRAMASQTTGIQNLSMSDFMSKSIVLPSRDEQNKFEQIYRQADKSKFGDFKSQFIEMVGDPRNNPKGWPTKRLSELAEYSIGLTYKPEQICDDGTIVLRSGNIQDGKISFSDIVRVNAPIKESLFVKEDDILMCSRNGSASLVGKVAMIPDINEPMTFGAFMTIIRSAEAKYLYLYFQSQDFRERVSEGKSSTMNQITQKMLDKVEVPFPDKDVRETLSAIASQADKSKSVIQKTLVYLNDIQSDELGKIA